MDTPKTYLGGTPFSDTHTMRGQFCIATIAMFSFLRLGTGVRKWLEEGPSCFCLLWLNWKMADMDATWYKSGMPKFPCVGDLGYAESLQQVAEAAQEMAYLLTSYVSIESQQAYKPPSKRLLYILVTKHHHYHHYLMI